MPTSTTPKTPRIKIVMTESVDRTYFLTEAQLEELGLPTTIDGLSELETDELGVTLIDELTEDDYAITEREFEIATEPENSPEALTGE